MTFQRLLWSTSESEIPTRGVSARGTGIIAYPSGLYGRYRDEAGASDRPAAWLHGCGGGFVRGRGVLLGPRRRGGCPPPRRQATLAALAARGAGCGRLLHQRFQKLVPRIGRMRSEMQQKPDVFEHRRVTERVVEKERGLCNLIGGVFRGNGCTWPDRREGGGAPGGVLCSAGSR